MNCIRRGTGKPLLLIHGLGGSWRSWSLIIDSLVKAGREVIAIDLPGHGATPPLKGDMSIGRLADAVAEFLRENNLIGVDAVGSSMGGRLVLELVRRGGLLGAVVSLDPGGFWQGWEVPVFYYSVAGSVRMLRVLQPVMPAITGSAIGRTLLFVQFSAHPRNLPGDLALDEVRSFAHAPAFDELLRQLAYGEVQKGARQGSVASPLVIGWGRQDRVCLPRQAPRALARFPDAQLHWFENCGHFPQWDLPDETVRLILAATADRAVVEKQDASKVASKVSYRGAVAAAFGVGFALALGGGLLLLGRRS